MKSLQVKLWQAASADLGLDLVAPFELTELGDHSLNAELLVKHFGAPRGMLIFQDSDEVLKYSDEVVEAGFGYSVMSEPTEGEVYSRDVFVEVLNDWGWSGDPQLKPAWISE